MNSNGSGRCTITTPSGTTSYTYDDLGRLATVTDSRGGITTYGYDNVGNLVQTELPNGVVETRQYDDLNRLVFLENKDANDIVLSSYTYTLDAVGNRTVVVEQDGRRVEYAYDDLYRLTQEAITDSVNGNRTISYMFDPVGNRLSRDDSTVGTTTYTYNANDWLLNETLNSQVTHYTYDNNGNTLSRIRSATDQVVYDWDYENRLVGANITDNSGNRQIEYQYDADGVRVAQAVNGVETRYLVDTNRPYAQVLEEYGNTDPVSYTYGFDLISQERAGVPSFYGKDGHSGVRLLTDAIGNVTDSYDYDAYGNLLQASGGTVNAYLYRGEQVDANLGMQYLRARYYNQDAGRFVTVDPFEGSLMEPMSRHRYLYGNGNPVSYSDPSGETTITAGGAGDAVIAQVIYYSLIAAGINVGILGLSILSRRNQEPQNVWTGSLSFYGIDSRLNLPIPIPGISGVNINPGLGSAELSTFISDNRMITWKYQITAVELSVEARSTDNSVVVENFDQVVLTSPRYYGTGSNVLEGLFLLGGISGSTIIPRRWFSNQYSAATLRMGAGTGTASNVSFSPLPRYAAFSILGTAIHTRNPELNPSNNLPEI